MNYPYLPWLLILGVLFVGCTENSTNAPNSGQKVTTPRFRPADDMAPTFGEHVSFASVGIKIAQPEGFEKSTTFDV
jgi:hypothetical protein